MDSTPIHSLDGMRLTGYMRCGKNDVPPVLSEVESQYCIEPYQIHLDCHPSRWTLNCSTFNMVEMEQQEEGPLISQSGGSCVVGMAPVKHAMKDMVNLCKCKQCTDWPVYWVVYGEYWDDLLLVKDSSYSGFPCKHFLGNKNQSHIQGPTGTVLMACEPCVMRHPWVMLWSNMVHGMCAQPASLGTILLSTVTFVLKGGASKGKAVYSMIGNFPCI